MANQVQTTYGLRTRNRYPGMIANSMPAKCESGVLVTGGTNSYPASLPFGTACGWVGESEVARSIVPKQVAILNADISNSATSLSFKSNQFGPAIRPPGNGDFIIIGSEWMLVGSGTSTGVTVVRGQFSSTAVSHTADAPIYVVGGRTNFAGVAVQDRGIRADNTPTDTYNENDHVTVGSAGDFEVVCKDAVFRGESVSVYVGSTAADYGKFSSQSPTNSSRSYIGIPNAVFMTDSASIKTFNASTSINVATLRLTSQPQ